MPPKSSKTVPDEDAVVTMSTLTQLLDQQKEFYKEMLHKQQDNFKSFIQIIMDGNTKRLDDVIKDVHELKASLQFTQGITEDMKSTYEGTDVIIKAIENDIAKFKKELVSEVRPH